jgi:siroheme synthase-like protein
MPNKYMPISISLAGRRTLIVGGGKVALRKVNNLLDYDCQVTVVAPEPVEKLEYYAERKRLEIKKRAYKSGEAADFHFVIAASDDEELNRAVYDDAHKAGVLVNAVDDPEFCDFIFPAVTKRGSLTIAVNTDGEAPYLSAYLRSVLDNVFPERWRKIANWASKFRVMVHQDGPAETEDRLKCFHNFISADWKKLLKEKRKDEEIEAELRTWMKL